ncbi:WPP domain-interacting protein 2-like [Henckelia pumila]|uniref:WPP domain-interacting protein 2-like n=1 Tax=Henckelia pumila TaxID=405737 RepID=UPI003C6E907E
MRSVYLLRELGNFEKGRKAKELGKRKESKREFTKTRDGESKNEIFTVRPIYRKFGSIQVVDLGTGLIPRPLYYQGEFRASKLQWIQALFKFLSVHLCCPTLKEVHDGSKNNAYCAVEDDPSYVIEGNGSDILGSVNLRPLETKHEVSPTPSMTRKGVGLKKWKRIRRDADKNGDGSVDAGKMVTSLDGFALLGDSEPSFAAGTDSENSEDRSSKSSTAASGRKSRYMTSGIVGFAQDRCSLGSSSGRNLMRSMQQGLKVKNQVETGKKARGERVKIEKENSHSSVESDSRSCNVLFIQGAYPTSNGKPSERAGASDGENGDKFYGRGRVFNDELPGGSEGHYEVRYSGKSNDDVVVDSSRGCKEDGSENHDSIVESIFALQSVQEALEKEVLKFREINYDASNDDPVRNLLPEFEDVSQKLQQATLERSQHDEGEVESLFKQKIEAEVEYLVFSRTGRRLGVDVVDQNIILGHLKAVDNEQSQMREKLQDTENKANMIKKEAEKLENCCKDIASANDTLTLQCGILKYTLCFFMQLVLFVVIIGVFMFQLLPCYVYDVPT